MKVPVVMHKAEKYAVNRRKCSGDIVVLLFKTFGCSRKVYNLYTDYYYSKLEQAGYVNEDDIPEIKLPEVSEFKKKFSYLKEVDSLSLANAKLNFGQAVKRFRDQEDHTAYTKRAVRRNESGTEPLSFRGLKGMPKFKSKAHGDFSYTTNCQYPDISNELKQPTIRLNGEMLHLPKFKEDIPLVIHRPFPDGAVIGSVTMSMDTDGALYASIEYSYVLEMEMNIRNAAVSGDADFINSLTFIGLDYSQSDFYVDSEGRKANYPHYYRKSEEKLAKLQLELSRMQRGSNNYNKKLAEIQKLHTKIRNQRRDWLQKEAHYLTSTYDVIIVEDIDLRAMGGSLSLGKNLHDNGFGMFRNMLARKLEEKGSVLVKVDRWYPSTKTCGECGYVNPDIILGVDEWVCPICGTHHLRDVNAAINIREEGRRIFADFFTQWLEEDQLARERAEKRTEARRNKSKKKKEAA